MLWNSLGKVNLMKKIFVVMACVAVMGFTLIGCSGGSDKFVADNFIGTWFLYSMTENGEETSHEDMELMRSLGLDVTLDLSGDGSAKLDLFGETMEGTWVADSGNTGGMIMEDQSVTMHLDENKLTLDQGGDTVMVFERSENSASAEK